MYLLLDITLKRFTIETYNLLYITIFYNTTMLIFDKGAKNNTMKKREDFNKWCWNSWVSTGKTKKEI